MNYLWMFAFNEQGRWADIESKRVRNGTCCFERAGIITGKQECDGVAIVLATQSRCKLSRLLAPFWSEWLGASLKYSFDIRECFSIPKKIKRFAWLIHSPRTS